MNCEICKRNKAETAIEKDGEELYVCRACAAAERSGRQKRRERTRKISRDGIEMSVTEVSGDGASLDSAPPFVKAIMNAFEGVISDIEKTASDTRRREKPAAVDFPTERTAAAYRVRGALHLEGLFLIGELEAVQRAMRALDMELVGFEADGVRDSGHVYRLRYRGGVERARRVVADLLEQERAARVRLAEELPRVFGDSLCRALAVLKNCRLLSPGELFDLLSPLRLAALGKFLDGIGLGEVDRLLDEQELDSAGDRLSPDERDRLDAERADRMNRRFEDVVLNERAEEKFL